MKRRWARLVLASAVVLAGGCGERPVVVSDRPRAGGTDVTFFVASDCHFGVEGIADLNRIQIEQMNSLPGTPYPPAIGGKVAEPAGVLICGDLTDRGRPGEWEEFARHYGQTGKEGLLRYPVFLATGNHDRNPLLLEPVQSQVRRRHGRLVYSWEWGDVHLVCLGMYPDAAAVRWLREDLAGAGRNVPVVIFFHYSVLGPFSEWWSERQKAAFARAIEGYNVVGIFHGHYHWSGHYTWRGLDVHLVGSPRHAAHRFLVVRITDGWMSVAAWNWDAGRWDWSYGKEINQQDVAGVGAGASGGGMTSAPHQPPAASVQGC